MATVGSDTTGVRELITDLCARNAAAELHYETALDKCATARVRLLAIENDMILTDKPQNPDRDVELCAGKTVTAHVRCGDDRCAFRSRVIKSTTLVRLNNRQRVVGMSLALPGEIPSRQRRRDFRVSVAGSAIGCRLFHEDKKHERACSRNVTVVGASLVNLASRGFAVAIEGPHAREFVTGDRLFCTFDLPDEDDPVVVYGEVRHARLIKGGVGCALGIMALDMPGWRQNRYGWRINRYVANEQRRKLKRRR